MNIIYGHYALSWLFLRLAYCWWYYIVILYSINLLCVSCRLVLNISSSLNVTNCSAQILLNWGYFVWGWKKRTKTKRNYDFMLCGSRLKLANQGFCCPFQTKTASSFLHWLPVGHQSVREIEAKCHLTFNLLAVRNKYIFWTMFSFAKHNLTVQLAVLALYYWC